MENNYDSSPNLGNLLAWRGIGGPGVGVGGYGGYGYGAGTSFANPTANAVRIDAAGDRAVAETKCSEVSSAAALDRISAQNFEGRFNSAITTVKDGQFQAELRSGDRMRDIEREMAANARIAAQCCCDTQKAIADAAKDAAQCCCDAKLEACKNTNEILAAIADNKATALAVESRNIERSLNAANAELTALRTQIACGCCNTHPHP